MSNDSAQRRKTHGASVAGKGEALDDSKGEGAFTTPTLAGDAWIVDSGVSSHMTPNKKYFATFKLFKIPEKVHLGDGRVVEAVGVGNIRLKMVFKVSPSKPANV